METKICTKCNIEKLICEFHKQKTGKYGVISRCKLCVIESHRDNKEQIAKQYKQWAEKNKTHRDQYRKKWREENKEHVCKYEKQYKQQHKEYYAKYNSEYNKQNSQTIIRKAQKKADKHNRRTLKNNSIGKHTGKDILALFDLQSGICPYCECKLYKSGKNKFHCDHIMPLSNGVENLQLLCPKCNLSKNNKIPEEFAANFNKLF